MTEFAKLVLAVDSTTAKSSKTDLDNLTESGKKAEGQFGSLKNAAVAVGAAMTAAAAAGAALVKAQIDSADAASKAASAAGVSVEQYTRLSYALKLGVDGGGDLSQTFLFLNKAIASGSDAFDSIGVSTRNADGSFRSADAVMLDVSDKFRLMEDGATKTAIAVELFGRSGDSMIPVLNGGSQALREAAAEADRLGVTLDKSTAVAAENFNDNLTRLESGALGFGNSLMSSTLPALNSVAEALLDDTSALNDTARAVAAAGAAYVAATIAMNAKVIALRAATLAQTAFNTAAKANPYAIAAAGLGLLVAAVYNYNKVTPEAVKNTKAASDAMTRFDAITRRAKEAIDAQNRSAAGMTLPQLKQQVDSVSASIEHLEILHKRAAADFARGAVSSGLVATYDAQLTEKRKQLDHLNALIGEKTPEIKSSAAATAPSRTVQQQPTDNFDYGAAGLNFNSLDAIAAEEEASAAAYTAARMERLTAQFTSERDLEMARFKQQQEDFKLYADAKELGQEERNKRELEMKKQHDANMLAAGDEEASAAAYTAARMERLNTQFMTERDAEMLRYKQQQDDFKLYADAKELDQEERNKRELEMKSAHDANMLAAGEMTNKAMALSALGSAETIFGAFSARSKTMFKLQKAAGIAQGLVSIQTGIANAMSLPWPLNLAAAANVAVTGAGIMSKLKSMTDSGGGSVGIASGGGSISAGSGGMPSSPGIIQQSAPIQQTTDIRLTGIRPDDMISGSYLQKIIEGIGETLADNGGKMGRVELVTA
jgi:hypothetical protein